MPSVKVAVALSGNGYGPLPLPRSRDPGAEGKKPPSPSSALPSSLGTIQNLVRVTLGDLRQHLQVLIGEQFGVRVALVDRAEHRGDRVRLALGPERAGLGLTARLQHHGFRLATGPQHGRLLAALRAQDRGLLLALPR